MNIARKGKFFILSYPASSKGIPSLLYSYNTTDAAIVANYFFF